MLERSPDFFSALEMRYKAEIAESEANIAVYIQNPAGIGEHPQVMEELEKQMMEIAKYDDVLEMIKKYFDGE